jgi:murein DD-endopeptidase MepM/ murein hydrolase activator NlpD
MQRLIDVLRARRGSRVWSIVAVMLLLASIAVSANRYGMFDSAIAAMRVETDVRSENVSGTTVVKAVSTVPVKTATPDPAQIESRHAYVSGRIENSLFEDGQQAGLSDALILKLVEIFGWDIDFALGIQPGDTFAVIHEEKYWMGQKIGDGPILAAEFSNRGKLFHALGYKNKQGVTKYYELDGITKQKRFLRTPIEFSRISSRYTDTASRFHPILKIWTAHKGIDYAAPMGTPIRAIADGRITDSDDIKSLQGNGGYGNALVIKHDAAYSTLYAHLSRFAPNIRVGSYVEQGQIIGYVGKTGLATGPHLHYEFHVRNVHRNPLQFKFMGTPVPAEDRQAFFAQSQPLVAKLKLITDRHLASNR